MSQWILFPIGMAVIAAIRYYRTGTWFGSDGDPIDSDLGGHGGHGDGDAGDGGAD
jgi:hypothetical protein